MAQRIAHLGDLWSDFAEDQTLPPPADRTV
jgi:hypothetical protein